MAISLIQTKKGELAAGVINTQDLTFDSNVTSGNLIIVGIGTRTPRQVTGITDSQGNTYTRIVEQIYNTSYVLDLWYAKNITGGANTVSITYEDSDFYATEAIIREYSGLTSDPLDVYASSTGNSSSPASGDTTSTAQNDELIIGIENNNAGRTSTAGSGFGNNVQQLLAGNWGVSLEDKTVSTTGVQSASFSLSGNSQWACAVATFRAGAGVSTEILHPLYLRSLR